MLFPDLISTRVASINLDHLAEEWFRVNGITEDMSNPFLDPDACGEMLAATHTKLGVDWSYGGWLEDRQHLWRGTYLDETRSYIHLGVDFNVPRGTNVAMCGEGEVILVESDDPGGEVGGWGTCVLVRLKDHPVILTFAHLDRETFVRVGDNVSENQLLGTVGFPPENGGWFPHLHVQATDAVYAEEMKQRGQFDRIDGYGNTKDLEELKKHFFDPLLFVSF